MSTQRRKLSTGPGTPTDPGGSAGPRLLPAERADLEERLDDQEHDATEQPTRGRRPLGDGAS